MVKLADSLGRLEAKVKHAALILKCVRNKSDACKHETTLKCVCSCKMCKTCRPVLERNFCHKLLRCGKYVLPDSRLA